MYGDLIGINTKGEVDAHVGKERRRVESVAALNANEKDYNLDSESIAALERGDRQRETGVYQKSLDDTRCFAETDGSGIFSNHICSLAKGHIGPHQCVAVAFCNKTWED